MPFYLHTPDHPPQYGTPFEDKRSALDWRLPHQTVTFVASEDEREDWQVRERDRFVDGVYLYVPWAGEDWHNLDHFAHLSISHPGMIAYTPDDEYGIQDRQKRIKPGKYLLMVQPSMGQADIDYWLGKVKSRGADLKITQDADEIETVYRNGPGSCMSKDASCYSPNGIHPTRVYAGPDLGVAYLGDMDERKFSARCVVWPEKKIYSRVYGDASTLKTILQAHGYSSGDLDGARIQAIELIGDGYVMPYVDGIAEAEYCAGYLILGSGDLDCTRTDGVSGDVERYECEHCGSSHDNEDSNYCYSCDNDRTCCDGCNEDYWDDITEIDGSYFCESCTSDRTHECEHCNENWEEDTRRPGPLCPSCVDDVAACETCGDWTDTSDLDSDGNCEDCREDEDEDTDTDTDTTEAPAVDDAPLALSYAEVPQPRQPTEGCVPLPLDPPAQYGEWSNGRPAVGDEIGTMGHPYCNANHDGWVCTRPENHTGDHIGHLSDGRVCARWQATLIVTNTHSPTPEANACQ
jgi:hypothetical protein